MYKADWSSARGAGAKDLKITWTPVKNLAAYIIEIEQDELNFACAGGERWRMVGWRGRRKRERT